MAEPYKRKTRFTGLKERERLQKKKSWEATTPPASWDTDFSGLKEHERLQKQRKADAKKAAERAKKRLKRMKPTLEDEKAKWLRDFKQQEAAKKEPLTDREWEDLNRRPPGTDPRYIRKGLSPSQWNQKQQEAERAERAERAKKKK